eukprot:485569_1
MSILLCLFVILSTTLSDNKRREELKDLSDNRYNGLATAPLYVAYKDVHWFEWRGVQLKLISADPITGKWVVYLKAKRGESLGIHRHYGTVWGMTVEGLFGYYEHENEWMAAQHDVIYETPGSVHTLFVSQDSPTEEALLFFIVEGALEFLDEYGKTIGHEDWLSITEKYYDFCEKEKLKCHDVTVPRGKAINVKWKTPPKGEL